jgi:hypothetical protein
MSDFFWCLFPEEENAFAAKKRDLRKKHPRFERERGQMMMRERRIKTQREDITVPSLPSSDS